MRFVFHNPHTLIWYKRPFYHFINGLKSVDKYDFLFDRFYSDKENKVYVYLDNSSSAPAFGGVLQRFNTPRIEFYVWVLINRLNPFKFRVVRNIEELTGQDVLLTFIYEHFTNRSGAFDSPRDGLIASFKRTKALKVVHLSHYGYHAGVGSKNAEAAGIDLFVCENNLSENSKFFRRHFPWYQREVYALPPVPKERFIRHGSFRNRKNKALAMGTITLPMDDPDFLEFFQDHRLQPMRHEIYDNAQRFSGQIDSYISHINEATPRQTPAAAQVEGNAQPQISGPAVKRRGIILRVARVAHSLLCDLQTVSRILLAFCLPCQSPKIGDKERAYFKFDVVEKYNEYRMFLCPEEAIDLPGIGFVEGMACGAAYIGIRDPMYADMGLIDKVHYIGYDGTLQDAVEKIAYYQENEQELERIAEAGYSFVHENFNGSRVSGNFISYLENLLESRKRRQP